MSHAILRMSEVRARTGLCKSTIYNLIKAQDFPKPIALSRRAKGWKEADIDQWIESRTQTGEAA